MKLSSFLVGMFVTATAVAIGTLTLGGTVLSAVLMWFATLVVAQLLYVGLLVTTARISDKGQYPCWQEGGEASVFSKSGEVSDNAVKHSAGPNA